MCVGSFTVKEQRMVRNPLMFSPLCLLGLTKVLPTVNNTECCFLNIMKSYQPVWSFK